MTEQGSAQVFRRSQLAAGLHFVATPIGAARDITLRALDVLASADVLAAEDTRTARRLMEIHGIPLADRPLLAYHDHNGPAMRPRLLAEMAAGRSVAYASEAGTPLVADPGYRLARAAIDAGLPVHAAPGPSAVLAALTISGLPSDRFLFAGFPPAAKGARRTWLEGLAAVDATVVLFESPKRVNRIFAEMADTLGKEREAVLCRELTKRFEEVLRGSIGSLSAQLEDRTLKGEVVILLGRPVAAVASAEDVAAALSEALARLPVKAAALEVSERCGISRREAYQLALRLNDRARGERR